MINLSIDFNVRRTTSVILQGDFWPDFATDAKEKTTSRADWVRHDWIIALLLSVVAAFGSYQISRQIDPVVFDLSTLNIWFDADIPRNFVDMNHRDSEYFTTHRHPLLPVVEYPPVYLLKKLLGLTPVTAVRITLAGIASFWLGGFFIILRFMGCRRADAFLFSLLAITSASAFFWLVVPETPVFAAPTILLALALVAAAEHRALSPLWYVLVSAATLAVTVTNWMMGILAAVLHHPWKRSLQITANAFCLVALAWVAQKFLFPGSVFFFGSSDVERLPDVESGGPLRVMASFLFHTIVMPAITATHWWYHPNLAVMTVQPSFPGSASPWGAIAALSWIFLFGLGIWGWWVMKDSGRLRIFLAFGLLGQLALHLLFARETFLYSLHFLPLLVALASLSTFTRARYLGLFLAAIVTVFGGINNSLQFEKAAEFVRGEVSEAYRLRTAMLERPADPWPRGSVGVLRKKTGRINDGGPSDWVPRSVGHVILGWPGSKEEEKAYHEPGGSFSPGVGSFGVSIWITDAAGNITATSDNIPLTLLREQLVWNNPKGLPGIVTDSPYYRAQWSAVGPGTWRLTIKTQPRADSKPVIVVRSVGPAGGPIRSLVWAEQRLLINDRWTVTVEPKPAVIHLGEEGKKGWLSERLEMKHWNSENGWGYAKIELGEKLDYNLLITDSNDAAVAGEDIAEYASGLRMNLPDDRFAASANAQIAHLMMGLVGQEARPGDPMSYPFAWLRDEAYITVALGRSGQSTAAKRLSKHLAENDFFGGFGAEADQPGLAIWALTDLALQLKQPQYDRWLWPHIRRKAELILEMLAADRPIHKPLRTPVIPLYTKPLPSGDPDITLVSERARDGLIIGRIDNSRPVLYVNAVSYLGLMDAALMADRLGESASAQQWRARATELKQAWSRIFDQKPPDERFALAYSLWPAWMANPKTPNFSSGLEASWANYAQDNFWQPARSNAFKPAEARQWLVLGRGDRAWTTLSAFWHHQESPGLYHWRSEAGPENTFNGWKNVRGWLEGQDAVVPSYKMAAEILLLQLDMLAYDDKSAAEPTLVIGAGIPPSWLGQPLSVRNLSTRIGLVNWTWDGRSMRVTISGSRPRVRLGSAWAPATPLRVEYTPRRLEP